LCSRIRINRPMIVSISVGRRITEDDPCQQVAWEERGSTITSHSRGHSAASWPPQGLAIWDHSAGNTCPINTDHTWLPQGLCGNEVLVSVSQIQCSKMLIP
jgi:hypothetical protein